jgi:hypothetical protein
MEARLGTGGRNRYEEACRQMIQFLEGLGPETRFGVTLFSTDGKRWRTRLTRADDAGLKAARSWLQAKRPDGGTNLRGGLFTGLEARRDGMLHPERIEADTVIVLCDGQTDRGPGWIDAWLDRVHDRTQLVFHCVQIGRGGDGTLERLAARTGGDHVRVDG